MQWADTLQHFGLPDDTLRQVTDASQAYAEAVSALRSSRVQVRRRGPRSRPLPARFSRCSLRTSCGGTSRGCGRQTIPPAVGPANQRLSPGDGGPGRDERPGGVVEDGDLRRRVPVGRDTPGG